MLTEEAIARLAESESISAAGIAVTRAIDKAAASEAGTDGHVALPSGYTLHDLEKHLPYRRRLRGSMATSVLESFAAYSKSNAEVGAAVFVDPANMNATAVLNLGDPDFAGHADNKAKYAPTRTAAFTALLTVTSSAKLSQQVLAEFLEDHKDNLTCERDGADIEVRKAVAAIRVLTIESLSKGTNAVGQLQVESTSFESVKASSADPIPAMMTFKCVPYLGFGERTFTMRLGIFTGEKEPRLTLRVVNAERHTEEMATELVDLVSAAIGDAMPVLVGCYAPGA